MSDAVPLSQADSDHYLNDSVFAGIVVDNNGYFRDFSEIEIRDAIDSLKNKNSRDVYNMSSRLVKSVRDLIVDPLTKLINLVLREGNFPDSLKTSEIVPVPKGGDLGELTNY